MPTGSLLGSAGLLLVSFIGLLGGGCDAPETQSDTDPAVDATSGRPEEPATKPGPSNDGKAEASECACKRPDSFAPAVQRVRPAVVNLYSARQPDTDTANSDTGDLQRFVPDKRLVESLGSGLIIDQQGHVVTNLHVIDGSKDLRARLLDDRWFKTSVVGTDPKTDLAVLKIVDGSDLPVAPLDSADDLKVGDWVVAIGNPLGLNSTVTVGIASGIGRSNLPMNEQLQYQDFIQTDASINPGNSGGPLVDAGGRVVGINTAISAEAQGIGFAIPVSMVRRIVPKLKAGGAVERSWVGLYVDALPSALRREIEVGSGGVLVTGVVDEGPADEAGIGKGDVIRTIDGRQVEDVDHIAWLAGHLSVGEPVEVLLQRGSEPLRVTLVPQSPPDNPEE